jgi:hypothetical protein
LKSILRDPLLHFLFLAIGLFVLHEIVAHDDADANARQIVVDRDALLNFIQYRTKSFDLEVAERQLASLTSNELDQIINDFIREEAMAREARELGLDQNDYVIKRRLVQKVDYVARGFADAAFKVTEDDIRAYFDENRSDFYIQPRITFTHVFFSTERHGQETAETLAAEALTELRQSKARFEDAGQYGERFLYGLNYVDRSRILVESHLGADFTDAIFSVDAAKAQWSGPFESEHGLHLVLVTAVQPGRDPALEDVRPQVVQQASRALSERRARETAQKIVDAYDVEVVYDPNAAVN